VDFRRPCLVAARGRDRTKSAVDRVMERDRMRNREIRGKPVLEGFWGLATDGDVGVGGCMSSREASLWGSVPLPPGNLVSPIRSEWIGDGEGRR
jgi:hypothetical protein